MCEPLLRPHADYFSGCLIQVHIVQPDTGVSSLLAVGVLPLKPDHIIIWQAPQCRPEALPASATATWTHARPLMPNMFAGESKRAACLWPLPRPISATCSMFPRADHAVQAGGMTHW